LPAKQGLSAKVVYSSIGAATAAAAAAAAASLSLLQPVGTSDCVLALVLVVAAHGLEEAVWATAIP
jgi:hypothetical protein